MYMKFNIVMYKVLIIFVIIFFIIIFFKLSTQIHYDNELTDINLTSRLLYRYYSTGKY